MIATCEPLVMTAEDYHADLTRDSHSSLDLFRESRERYAMLRIHRNVKAKPATVAQEYGGECHVYVLEPELFASHFEVGDGPINPTTGRPYGRTSQKYTAWAESVGRPVITSERLEELEAMRAGIMRNEFARDALESPGLVERVFHWEDELTGLPLKCRPDKLLDSGLVVDLKTSSRDISPDGFARTIEKMGYHRQAALYLDGLDANGIAATNFAFIVVDTEFPHECAVHEIGERSIEAGRRQNRRTLDELARCRRENEWSGRWRGDLVRVDISEWALKREGVMG